VIELVTGQDLVVTCGKPVDENPFYFFLRQGDVESVEINAGREVKKVMGEAHRSHRIMESVLDGFCATKRFRVIQLVDGIPREFRSNPHNADPIYFLFGLAVALNCWEELATELKGLSKQDTEHAWEVLEFTARFHQESPHRNRYIRLRTPESEDYEQDGSGEYMSHAA